MKEQKKIFITDSSNIGNRCKTWAISNSPSDCEIVDTYHEANYIFSVFHNEIFKEHHLQGKSGCFNFHGGILPDYRGSCTLNWAIINNENQTGVTLHVLDIGIDTGPIIDICRVPIEKNETAGSLYKKLENSVFELFIKWYLRLLDGKYNATDQMNCGKLYKKQDIAAAKDLTKYVRAFEFFGKEGAFYFTRSGQKIYLSYED